MIKKRMMTAYLYHEHTPEKDNVNEFGLEFGGEINQFYIQWVYYYLGAFFKDKKKPSLFPFAFVNKKPIKRLVCTYMDAEKLANSIGNTILKKTKEK